MKGKRALLLFVFILFLVLPAANAAWIKYIDSPGSAEEGLPEYLTSGEIKLDNSGKYRDGVIDNFDYFLNPGYPAGATHAAGNIGSG